MIKKQSKGKQKRRWLRLPSKDFLIHHPRLKFVRRYLGRDYLWRFDATSVPRGLFIGVFMGFMPIPFQMIPATLLSILWRGNLVISIALVWISNPITMPPLLYFCYRFGLMILRRQTLALKSFSVEHLMAILPHIWLPLAVGCLAGGFITALLSFVLSRMVFEIMARRKPRV